MNLYGTVSLDNQEYNCLFKTQGQDNEVYLIQQNKIVSGYKNSPNDKGLSEFIHISYLAKNVYNYLQKELNFINIKSTKQENLVSEQGVLIEYTKEIKTARHRAIKVVTTGEYVLIDISKDKGKFKYITLALTNEVPFTQQYLDNLNFIDVTFNCETQEEVILTTPLDVISLSKDTTWLNNKQYHVLTKTEDVLKYIGYLANYDGLIAYDTETTGTRINMFGQYGSKHYDKLISLNQELEPSERFISDSLVGVCISTQENTGYYIPLKHKYFENALENNDDPTIKHLKNRLFKHYKERTFEGIQNTMKQYITSLSEPKEIPNDVLFMELMRDILSKGNHKIVAHNLAFDWKVNHLYSIDTKFTEDTMLIHQLIYKFKGGTSVSSSLKEITKDWLGIDQLGLKDFFKDFKEDETGKSRGKSKIDFSYMDYNGTKSYAPADADLTLIIYNMMERDILQNHKDILYLYAVELTVAHAIAYMEFYGLRIDVDRIENARLKTLRDKLILEHKIRLVGNLVTEDEVILFKQLEEQQDSLTDEELQQLLDKCSESLKGIVDSLGTPFNISSNQQAKQYFFGSLGIKCPSDKESLDKKTVGQLVKLKNTDGTLKYPIMKQFQEFNELSTQLSKFYTKLPEFMYPDGYMFASYGQIATNTGRMSCSKPNNQQLPKYVTSLVIPREDSVFMDADFSQIEYRALVALANEPELIEKFKNPDTDYHTMQAALMFGVPYEDVTDDMRSQAKAFNFGIPFGMGDVSLAIRLCGNASPESIVKAKEKKEDYFRNQPNVRQFFVNTKKQAKIRSYTSTLWNRKRHYSFVDKDGNYDKRLEGQVLRQAGNAVIQGTAADIFKIAVARTWCYIRENNLLGLVHITNLVHDEQLIEINTKQLNVQRCLTDIINCMELNLKEYNFPPLYVGAGIGNSWKDAKGKMAEIHPTLASQLTQEAQQFSLYGNSQTKVPTEPKEVLDYFNSRVYNYRKEVVETYLKTDGLTDTAFKSVVGNLINLQFNYKLPEDIEKLDSSIKGKKALCYRVLEFIKEFNVDVDSSVYEELFNRNIVLYDTEAEKEELVQALKDGEESRETLSGRRIEEINKLGVDPISVAKEYGYCLYEDVVVLNLDVFKYRKNNLGLGYIQVHTQPIKDSECKKCFIIIDNQVYEYQQPLYNVTTENLDLVFNL